MDRGDPSCIKLLVDADYGVEFPVWFVDGPEEVEPTDLPLSPGLIDGLRSWSANYASPVWERGTDSWPGDEWWAAWIDEGRDLARRVLSELGGGYEVVYFNDATEEDEQVLGEPR